MSTPSHSSSSFPRSDSESAQPQEPKGFVYICGDARCGKAGYYPENADWICPHCHKTNSILIKPYPLGKSRRFTLHWFTSKIIWEFLCTYFIYFFIFIHQNLNTKHILFLPYYESEKFSEVSIVQPLGWSPREISHDEKCQYFKWVLWWISFQQTGLWNDWRC